MEKRSFDFEVRFAVAEEAQGPEMARGYAAVFNSDSRVMFDRQKRTRFIERIAPTAFTRSLEEAALGQRNIMALWEHQTSGHVPLGSTKSGTLTLTRDEHGLAFTLDPARLTDQERLALRDGDLQVSFGFVPRETAVAYRQGGVEERTVHDLDLNEISLVQRPAYLATEATIRTADGQEVTDQEIADAEARSEPEEAAEVAPEPVFDIAAAKALLEKTLRETAVERVLELASTKLGPGK